MVKPQVKTAQIATLGFKADWIQRGLYKYPTDLLILITTLEFSEIADEVKKVNKEIPIEVKYATKPRDQFYMLNLFKDTVIEVVEHDFDVIINLTSGLTSWQLWFYFIATILAEKVKILYIIDKELEEPIELILLQSLAKTERKILNCIDPEGSTLRSIVEAYRQQHRSSKGSKGLISRYLRALASKGLVKLGTGTKERKYSLTTEGSIYTLFAIEE